MKRLLLALLAVLMVFAVASCGGDGNKPGEGNSNETVAETAGETAEEAQKKEPKRLSEEEKAKFFKVVEFTLPEENFRDVIVDYMRYQASIEWVCGADFGVHETFNSWGIDLSFKRGQKYTGIPYADTKVSYTQFKDALVNGRYTCESDKWKEVFGVQCVSSVMNSIQQFDNTVYGFSSDLTPGLKQFKCAIVGEYTIPEGVQQTKQIIDANTPAVMGDAYALLKKGDIITRQDLINDNSHIRVIAEDPVIVKNAQGKVNLSRSYVTCVEQTNSFDATRTDGVKTTWYLDHMYTFDQLRTTDYVPLTLPIYSKDVSEYEIPYITLSDEIQPAQIQKNSLGATVRSNFPIRYVHLDVYNKDGGFVKRSMAYDMASAFAVGLRKYSMTLTEGLENGDYTLVVSAGIARGSAELTRVDFTINK